MQMAKLNGDINAFQTLLKEANAKNYTAGELGILFALLPMLTASDSKAIIGAGKRYSVLNS